MTTKTSAPRVLPVAGSSQAVAEPELRTSNGVAGYRFTRPRAVLYVLKILLSVPLLPLWPFMVAHVAGDWSFARNYFGTLAYCLKTIYTHVRFGSWVRLVKYNLLLSPEEVEKRIAARSGACTRCAKCCKQYDCLFLGQDPETEDYTCKAYETGYWFYGTCGRYPLEQSDVDDHSCPGFSFEGTPYS